MCNKILICLCCSECACSYATFYDQWASYEACGLCCVNCAGCCWTICAPICHNLKCGDTGKGMDFFKRAVKFGIYGCLVGMCAPCDGCYNCIKYNIKNCKEGVTGVNDILLNCKFIARKIENALEIKGSNEPDQTFRTFTP